MRFAIEPTRLKALARHFKAHTPAIQLAHLHEALARGLGYNSWRDLRDANSLSATGAPLTEIPIPVFRPHDDEAGSALKQRIKDALIDQIASAFAQSRFGATFPMLQDRRSFVEIVERVGFVEDCLQPMKRAVRQWRASREVNSPFYEMSLSSADDELAEAGSEPIASFRDLEVMPVTAIDLRTAILNPALAPYVATAWPGGGRQTLDELLALGERAQSCTDGQRSWPLLLAAINKVTQGLCSATWQQLTPHAQPTFSGVLHLHAVVAPSDEALQALARGCFRYASWGLRNALWAMTGRPDAQLHVRVALSDQSTQQRQLGAAFLQCVRDEPGFQSAATRFSSVTAALIAPGELGSAAGAARQAPAPSHQ